MFGSTLYQAFCELKQTFDPAGLLNPGKIVHAPPLTANLRFGPEYHPALQAAPALRPGTALDFSEFGGLLGAAEQCGGGGGRPEKPGGGHLAPHRTSPV